MDRVKIKFKSKENNWKYQLRIPENLEWFNICRYYKTKEKDMYIYIYVHEKIIFDCFAYYNIKDKKFGIILNQEEKEEIIKQTAFDLIESLGINKFILEILYRLSINIKPLKKYVFKNIFRKKDKYYLSKYTKDDKYQFDIIDSNGNVIGSYSEKGGNVDLLVLPNQKIEFDSFLKEKEHKISNAIKTLVKRK